MAILGTTIGQAGDTWQDFIWTNRHKSESVISQGVGGGVGMRVRGVEANLYVLMLPRIKHRSKEKTKKYGLADD